LRSLGRRSGKRRRRFADQLGQFHPRLVAHTAHPADFDKRVVEEVRHSDEIEAL
jgi:hypothetical protein